jgi:hypothetical protein
MTGGHVVPGDPPLDIEDILAGLRTGRLRERSAAALVEQRLGARRQVRAHATPALPDRLVKAVDSALAGDGGDEYSALFPPSAPLGPDEGHVEYPSAPLVYPGEDQGKRRRQPRTGYAAAALTDDQLYDALFGPLGQDGEGAG